MFAARDHSGMRSGAFLIRLKTLHNKLKEYGSVSAEAAADKEEKEEEELR